MTTTVPEYFVSKLGRSNPVSGDGVSWRLAFQDSAGAPVVDVIMANAGMFGLIEDVLQRMGYTAEEIHNGV